MKCGLYGLYFDDVRDQVRWLPAPCVLGVCVYIYIYKFTVILGLEKPGCYMVRPDLIIIENRFLIHSMETGIQKLQ
jgi:hypothetical protein